MSWRCGDSECLSSGRPLELQENDLGFVSNPDGEPVPDSRTVGDIELHPLSDRVEPGVESVIEESDKPVDAENHSAVRMPRKLQVDAFGGGLRRQGRLVRKEDFEAVGGSAGQCLPNIGKLAADMARRGIRHTRQYDSIPKDGTHSYGVYENGAVRQVVMEA